MRQAALVLAILTVAATPQDPAPSGSALIDQEISRTWTEAGVTPAGPSEDAEFLRRVSLDIIGTLPTADETLAFLKNTAADKRAAKIDELLARPEYAHAWAELWENLLVGYDQAVRNDSKKALYSWLKDEVFAKNLPYDLMVRAVVASSGINTDLGPVNYLIKLTRKDAMGAVSMASRTSKLFMSTQIQCAQCHDHPFERFTQEDFHGMVAFFVRTKFRKVDKDSKENRLELYDAPAGEASYGEGKKKVTVAPRFIDGAAPDPALSRREAFAALLLRPENSVFARSLVNRYWARFFGRGIIDPVDDFSARFKPSHPELLDRLARDFVAHNYDLAWLIRSIANSRTYQLSSRTPATAASARVFAFAATRPLTPEQLEASVRRVFALADGQGSAKNPGDLLRQFRTKFGDEEMADRGVFEGTIPQALMMMNGSVPNSEISRANNMIDGILKQYSAPEDRIERIFLSVLSRPPSPGELSKFVPYVQTATPKRPRDPYEDVFWVLLNSSEFLFNH